MAKADDTGGGGEGRREGEEEIGDEEVREVMDRAIRRLNIMETFFLVAALVLALLGGGVVAWLFGLALDVPFRYLWVGASLLLFVIPGVVVFLRARSSNSGKGGGAKEED